MKQKIRATKKLRFSITPLKQYEMHVFQPDNRRNPYSRLMDNFFKRHLPLISFIDLVLTKNLLSQVHFYGRSLSAYNDIIDKSIIISNKFIINKKNKSKNQPKLSNYLAISITSQIFENFEAFIRDIYRLYLKQKIKDPKILERALKNLPRDNKEILKDFKSFFPSTNKVFDLNTLEWFSSMEKIRHSVVHSNQLVKDTFLKENKKESYSDFYLLKAKTKKLYQPLLDSNSARHLNDKYCRTAYYLFLAISSDCNYSDCTVIKKVSS